MSFTSARTILPLSQTVIIVALLASVFATTPSFFQPLINAKKYFLEQGLLLAVGFLAISLPFMRDIRITTVDAAVFLLASWFIGCDLFIISADYESQKEIEFNLILWLTVYLFLRSGKRETNHWFRCGVAGTMITIALLQSMLGLFQLYGLESSYHGLFKITGTFHNPGPFSGFVVSTLPLAITCYKMGYTEWRGRDTEIHREISFRGINFNPQKIFHGVFRGVSLLTIITILLVIPAAQSRAAWMAGLAGSIYVLWSCRDRFPFITNLLVRFQNLSRALRILFFAGSFLLILGGATGIYLLKKDSANGRLLIWQVTSQLVKERPITGHGSGAFNSLYMDEQAKWFESGRGTEEQAMVAGSPESPFNEPLKLWLEKGLIGLLLASGILGFIFFPKVFNSKPETLNTKHETRNKKLLHPFPTRPTPLKGEPQTRIAKTPNTEHETRNSENKTLNSGLKGTLISILTFSLFSYPFDISSFTLQLIVVIAMLSSTTPLLANIKGRKNLVLTIPAIALLIAGSICYFPKRQAHYTALKIWQEATQFYNMHSYKIASEAYEEAFPVLQNNGLFLQMYGKALSMNEQHHKSNKILDLAQKNYSSYIIQNTLGDNHKALGNYEMAEIAYKKSANMVPGLLLPKYLLAKMYVKSGEIEKAKATAKLILNSPVKVKSTATNEIMREMRNIITLSSTEEPQSLTENLTNQPF